MATVRNWLAIQMRGLIHTCVCTVGLPVRELEHLCPLRLPILASTQSPLACPTDSKLSQRVSGRSTCSLVIHFRHTASWLDLPTATENKSLLHFSCVTSLTNKLLSQFYTDSSERPNPCHGECILQAIFFFFKDAM